MKKITLFCFCAVFVSVGATAQLANSKWSGTINVVQPSGLTPMGVVWEFGRDTATATVTGGEPEVFSYKRDKNILTMTKVSGGSACAVGATTKMSFAVKGKELTLVPMGSSCETYQKASADKPYIKMD